MHAVCHAVSGVLPLILKFFQVYTVVTNYWLLNTKTNKNEGVR